MAAHVQHRPHPGQATTKPLESSSPGPPTRAAKDAPRRHPHFALIVGVLFTIGLIILSLFTGVYDLSSEGGYEMFFITRIPRTVALVLSGSAMAICGLVMQLMTQNRFVEPTTTGTTEWAGLGLLVIMLINPSAPIGVRMLVAVVFAFVGTFIFFMFLRRVRLTSSLIVPIVGIMMGSVIGSFTTFLALETDRLQVVNTWFQGSFSMVERGRYELLLLVVIFLVAIFIIADRFTVAGLGKEVATNLGLNYNHVLFAGVGIIAAVSGIVTVVIGSLPFLGLIVPNMVSLLRGDNLRTNLPWVALAGMWIVTICDIIGRTIIAPFEVPVSLVLGVIGSITFVFLLLRQRRRG